MVLVEQRQFLGGTPIAESYAGLTPYGEPAQPRDSAAWSTWSPPTPASAPGSGRSWWEWRASRGRSHWHWGGSGAGGDDRQTGAVEAVECGAIVIATGFAHFDPGRATQMYGYYEFADVITQPELELMMSQHRVVRPSTGEAPQRVCFVQCVGSRDRQIGNEYCSKVCCGVASKEAIDIRRLLPESKVFIFYIDMRMYGYWENRIYWPAQEQHHVQYVKGLISEVLPKDGRLLVRGEDTTMGRPMELLMDLVVLSVGMEPSPGTRQVAKLAGVKPNKYGFVDAPGAPLDPVSTDREGIFACGAALGPADLEDTVSSASNAAVKAFAYLQSRMPAVAG